MSRQTLQGRRIRLGMVGGGEGLISAEFIALPPGLTIATSWWPAHLTSMRKGDGRLLSTI